MKSGSEPPRIDSRRSFAIIPCRSRRKFHLAELVPAVPKRIADLYSVCVPWGTWQMSAHLMCGQRYFGRIKTSDFSV